MNQALLESDRIKEEFIQRMDDLKDSSVQGYLNRLDLVENNLRNVLAKMEMV